MLANRKMIRSIKGKKIFDNRTHNKLKFSYNTTKTASGSRTNWGEIVAECNLYHFI